MPETPDAEEARRLERIRLLLENDLTAEEKAWRVPALIGSTFEASVRGLTPPAAQATILAIESGLVLLQYADGEQSRYWVPLNSIQWLKAVQ